MSDEIEKLAAEEIKKLKEKIENFKKDAKQKYEERKKELEKLNPMDRLRSEWSTRGVYHYVTSYDGEQKKHFEFFNDSFAAEALCKSEICRIANLLGVTVDIESLENGALVFEFDDAHWVKTLTMHVD